METNRQVRLLIPPFVLLVSLAWGAALDPANPLKGLFTALSPTSTVSVADSTTKIVGLLAAGGILVVALGFLISTISIFFLRLLFLPWWMWAYWKHGTRLHYEATLSPATLTRLSTALDKSLGLKADPDGSKRALYLAAAFDHILLPPGIHDWLGRRWNMFNVSVHSMVALGLSLLVGGILTIQIEREWSLAVGGLALALGVNAVLAQRETMKMVEFLSHRATWPQKPERCPAPGQSGV